MHQSVTAKIRLIANLNMPSQCYIVCKYVAMSNRTIVTNMAVRHNEISISNSS